MFQIQDQEPHLCLLLQVDLAPLPGIHNHRQVHNLPTLSIQGWHLELEIHHQEIGELLCQIGDQIR